jgi:hypothetical protein
MDDDELTEDERRALRALPAEAPVPEGLEDRVVAELRGRGLVAPARPAPASRRIAALAAAAALAVGLGAGYAARGLERPRRVAPEEAAAPAAAEGGLFLLWLYDGPGTADDRRDPAAAKADEAARVAEYGAWAAKLRREGRLAGAEKLRAPGLWLSADGPAAPPPASWPLGYFLVRARHAQEAEALGRECPHLRHGGRVAVQAVDPT